MSLMLCQTLHAWFAVLLRVLRAMCARRIHAGLAVHAVFKWLKLFLRAMFSMLAPFRLSVF